jgi:hypothetical protein
MPGTEDPPRGEAGRRVERVEWGLRTTRDNFLHAKGHVEPRPSEQNARELAGRGLWGDEVVARTVVTYTTRWGRGDAS